MVISVNFFQIITVICPLPRLCILGRWSARSGSPPPTAIIIYIHITETDSFRMHIDDEILKMKILFHDIICQKKEDI